jgi:CDP-6-deoxy-D-xylo-4-hexulose-3-dehydrase
LVGKCKGKIEIRPIVGGDMVHQPFFKKYIMEVYPNNLNAKIIHKQGLYFGNNPELTEKEIAQIIALFTK